MLRSVSTGAEELLFWAHSDVMASNWCHDVRAWAMAEHCHHSALIFFSFAQSRMFKLFLAISSLGPDARDEPGSDHRKVFLGEVHPSGGESSLIRALGC